MLIIAAAADMLRYAIDADADAITLFDCRRHTGTAALRFIAAAAMPDTPPLRCFLSRCFSPILPPLLC